MHLEQENRDPLELEAPAPRSHKRNAEKSNRRAATEAWVQTFLDGSPAQEKEGDLAAWADRKKQAWLDVELEDLVNEEPTKEELEWEAFCKAAAEEYPVENGEEEDGYEDEEDSTDNYEAYEAGEGEEHPLQEPMWVQGQKANKRRKVGKKKKRDAFAYRQNPSLTLREGPEYRAEDVKKLVQVFQERFMRALEAGEHDKANKLQRMVRKILHEDLLAAAFPEMPRHTAIRTPKKKGETNLGMSKTIFKAYIESKGLTMIEVGRGTPCQKWVVRDGETMLGQVVVVGRITNNEREVERVKRDLSSTNNYARWAAEERMAKLRANKKKGIQQEKTTYAQNRGVICMGTNAEASSAVFQANEHAHTLAPFLADADALFKWLKRLYLIEPHRLRAHPFLHNTIHKLLTSGQKKKGRKLRSEIGKNMNVVLPMILQLLEKDDGPKQVSSNDRTGTPRPHYRPVGTAVQGKAPSARLSLAKSPAVHQVA